MNYYMKYCFISIFVIVTIVFQDGFFISASVRTIFGGTCLSNSTHESTINTFPRKDKDDTERIQSMLDKGGVISLQNGQTYKITKPLNIIHDNTTIVGNNAIIEYYYEQNTRTPSNYESLFTVKGKNNVQFRSIILKYFGTFTISSSYGGMVSGIYVEGAKKFVADGVSASNFNRAGINLGGGSKLYNTDPIVRNCYLHNNRIAGCLYGNNENGLIEKNRFERNGLKDDYLTGYGFTGWAASLPKNTKVIDNVASYNYRKGIDFHSGENGTISNNVCEGNLIIGIFVHGVIGKWVISDNVIKNMNGDSTSFATMAGIEIGNRDRNFNSKEEISFTIARNTIQNFTTVNNKKKVTIPMLIHVSSIGKGNINIYQNRFDCGSITNFITANPASIRKNSEFYDVIVKNNSFNAISTRNVPFYFRGENNRHIVMERNEITIDDPQYQNAFLILRDKSTVVGNDMIIKRNTFKSKRGDQSKNVISKFSREASNTLMTRNKIRHK